MKADGSFEGYASLFGAEDLGRDVVMPGAFRKSLLKRGARGVKLLYQHEPNEGSIGKVTTEISQRSTSISRLAPLARSVSAFTT